MENEDHARVRARPFDGLLDGVEDGDAFVSCPPLPGVTPATTLVPLCSILPVWNAPSLPVMP